MSRKEYVVVRKLKPMALDDLTPLDRKLYEYIKRGDFVTNAWSTPKAARELRVKEEDIYQSLSNLVKHLSDKVQIDYRDGALRILAE